LEEEREIAQTGGGAWEVGRFHQKEEVYAFRSPKKSKAQTRTTGLNGREKERLKESFGRVPEDARVTTINSSNVESGDQSSSSVEMGWKNSPIGKEKGEGKSRGREIA